MDDLTTSPFERFGGRLKVEAIVDDFYVRVAADPVQRAIYPEDLEPGIRKLKLFLERFSISSAVLNAELPANSRAHILASFNRGVFDYLIATDATVVDLPTAVWHLLCEDADALQRTVIATAPEDIRMRFFSGLRQLPDTLAKRLTQIDYDREMAFVCESALLGVGLLGVVRIAADPDRARAEYAIALRSDLKGIGLGRRLMIRILDYAKARGVGEVFGEIMRENHKMIDLCRSLGFRIAASPEAPELVHASLIPADWAGGAGALELPANPG